MTKIQCRYGKANFELTKACLAPHEDGMPGNPTPAPNFSRHFSRIQAAMKIRARHGGRLPLETSPRYSPLPDSSEPLAHEKTGEAAANANAGHSEPEPAKEHGAATPQPPMEEAAATRPARLPQLSVALTSSLLAIGIAIIVGLAIGKAGAFRNAGTPALPAFGARHAAAGPIVPPPSDPAAIAPVEPENRVAIIERPAPPAIPTEPAAAEKEAPAETPATATHARQHKLKASSTETPSKTKHAKKKKHKKARIDPPSPQNPFTGDKLPYSAQAPSPPSIPTTRSRLEQCRHLSSLIRSELCRWRICKNKWGRDGCPSYEHGNPGRIGMRSALQPYRANLN